jgi:hypothetical protein
MLDRARVIQNTIPNLYSNPRSAILLRFTGCNENGFGTRNMILCAGLSTFPRRM